MKKALQNPQKKPQTKICDTWSGQFCETRFSRFAFFSPHVSQILVFWDSFGFYSAFLISFQIPRWFFGF